MKKSKKEIKSAVVDTNVFVSGLIVEKGLPSQLIDILEKDFFTLIISKILRQELEEVLGRAKFSAFLSENKISKFFRMIDTISIVVSPTSNVSIDIRDPKDQRVLATALGGKADFLVTGDEDLLVLKGSSKLGKLQIVSVREFIAMVK